MLQNKTQINNVYISLILILLFTVFTPAHALNLKEKLDECQTHLKANRLTTGKGETALACYEAVLKQDPTNSEAWRGLDQIKVRYQSWMNKALNRGQQSKVQAYQARLALVLKALQNNEEARKKLAEKKAPRAVEHLIRKLGSRNWRVREAAAKALWQLKDPRAVEPLIQRLGDENWEVRQAAAKALGQLKDPRAVERLIQRLGDWYENVRQAAADNLIYFSPSYFSLAYSLNIPWNPMYWKNLFSIKQPNKVLIKIIQSSPQYWFYLFIIAMPLGLSVGFGMIGLIKESFAGTFLDRLFHSTFSRVIMLTLINLVCAFVVIASVTISPLILLVALALFLISLIMIIFSEELIIPIMIIIGVIFFNIDSFFNIGFWVIIIILELIIVVIYMIRYFLFILGGGIQILFATYLFKDMTWALADPLILDGLKVVLALLLIGYLLGFLIVILTLRFRPWLKASKTASSWVCQSDYTRYTQLGSDLPWLVRWSGRFLAVEVPKKHDDFADYFVCRTCGKNRHEQAFQTSIKQIIGVIGGMTLPQETYQENGQRCLAVNLFSNPERQASNADIERLYIHSPLGETIDYDYAVNAVIIALSEDHNRPRPLKKVPVTLYGNPPLSENTRRILAKEFGKVKNV